MTLYGILHCHSSDIEKAAVFHRVIAPEYSRSITVRDPDLRTALFFLISCATVLEEMTRDLENGQDVDYEKYERKLERYKPTFDGMMNDFLDDLFGEYCNSISGK